MVEVITIASGAAALASFGVIWKWLLRPNIEKDFATKLELAKINSELQEIRVSVTKSEVNIEWIKEKLS